MQSAIRISLNLETARNYWWNMKSLLSASYKTAALLALLSAAVLIAGCGGGSGGGSAAVVFTPNYISSLNGLYHWASLPVKIYFDTPADWGSYYSSGLPSDAASSWNIPNAPAFFSVVSKAADATVVCSFVYDPLPEWGSTAQAITYYAYYTDTKLLVPGKVSITCAIRDRRGRVLSSELMQAVIAHELGHAMGIAGHSPNTDDLMYSQLQPGLFTPQERDINTAKSAYYSYFSAQPGISSQPVSPGPADSIVYRTIE